MTISAIIKICAALYLTAILIDLGLSKRFLRFLLELIPLVCLLIIDLLITDASSGYIAFGPGSSPTIAALAMFVAILLGIAARYIFYLKGEFSWLDFIKPLCISPILLLPLLGSVQSIQQVAPIQLVSFALLAFQNGFFWQAVLTRAKKKASH